MLSKQKSGDLRRASVIDFAYDSDWTGLRNWSRIGRLARHSSSGVGYIFAEVSERIYQKRGLSPVELSCVNFSATCLSAS